jgi:Rps23 Pro-64 3,4-dihydroxylase Tpa1-like proline 4-hydroxylase
MSKIKKHRYDAFSVLEFMTEEECKKVIAYLEFLADSGNLKWNQISFYESYAMGFWDTDINLLAFGLPADYFKNLNVRIREKVEECLGFKVSEISYHAQKWIEGAFASFHSDNCDEEGNPTPFERSRYAAFLYLNEDFTGGKLNFKHFDLSIEPKVGMLAVFAGGFGMEHEVATVNSGTRYTIGSFWDRADAVYSDEQKEAWAKELADIRALQDDMYKAWDKGKEIGNIPIYKSKEDL